MYYSIHVQVTDRQQLRENYLRTKRFTYDAIAIIPLPYLLFLIRLFYWLIINFMG